MARTASGGVSGAAKAAPKRTAAGKAPARSAPSRASAPAKARSTSHKRQKGLQDNPVASFTPQGRPEQGASPSRGAAPARRGRPVAASRPAAKAASRKAPAKPQSKRRQKGLQDNPLAGFNDELFQTNLPAEAFAAPAPKRQTAQREVYDELDLPPQKRQSAPRDAYDELDLPPQKRQPAPREVYDELDLPPQKRQSAQREVYDELDLPPAQRRRRGGGRRNRGFGVANLFLLLAILALAGVGVWRTLEYRALAEMKAVVSRQTFYPGTTVEGIDVSDMTLEQALSYWGERIEPIYRQTTVTLSNGVQLTAEQLGYASNYESVLKRAWNTGRSGSLEERYLRASAGSARAYRIERSAYDDARVRELAAYAAQQVDAQPQEARVAAIDTDTRKFVFTQESVGYRLDQSALVTDVESALNAGGGSVELKIETLQPAVTAAEASSQYGLIASAVTNASSSSSNRLANIRLAMSIINGTRLAPGERFSFNETVGQRTAARGFKVATAYSQGTVTEEVGGGICQVSTTLFNAAVKADLKINERHPHSLTVSYVDLGKDAAVDWGNKDLKFTNSSQDDIYILCDVTDDKRLVVSIYGRLLPNGETITVEGVKTGELDYETQYQINFNFYSGQTKKLQSGKKGYTAEAYKIRWDANGNEISREVLCKSRYSATPEIIEYGP